MTIRVPLPLPLVTSDCMDVSVVVVGLMGFDWGEVDAIFLCINSTDLICIDCRSCLGMVITVRVKLLLSLAVSGCVDLFDGLLDDLVMLHSHD